MCAYVCVCIIYLFVRVCEEQISAPLMFRQQLIDVFYSAAETIVSVMGSEVTAGGRLTHPHQLMCVTPPPPPSNMAAGQTPSDVK